jgi:hypothetical protein
VPGSRADDLPPGVGAGEAALDALIRRADDADAVAADQLFARLYHQLHRTMNAT